MTKEEAEQYAGHPELLALDNWVAQLLEEWDDKLPRELVLELDHNWLIHKAVELGVPHSTVDIVARYQHVLRPLRKDSFYPTEADLKALNEHVGKYGGSLSAPTPANSRFAHACPPPYRAKR